MAKITIEQLAGMIKKSFDGVDKKFEEASKVQTVIQKDVKDIKLKLDKVESIEKEVDYIKGILNIPTLKNN